MRRATSIAVLVSGALAVSPALAACPIELAIYGERNGVASIEFAPAGEAAAVSNAFRLLVGEAVVLDGVVMWSGGVERPNGMLMHECPEGDVTGAEIAACTAWQGIVYTVGDDGAVGLLPRQGEPAPKRLLLPDLAHALSVSSAAARLDPQKLPWDVFEMTGCQE